MPRDKQTKIDTNSLFSSYQDPILVRRNLSPGCQLTEAGYLLQMVSLKLIAKLDDSSSL